MFGSSHLGLPTDQRKTGFYIGWFFRLYYANDSGWWPARTPDGRSIGEQDAYFWRCLEIIAQTLVTMRLEELNKRGK
jgi:hypothetical protein